MCRASCNKQHEKYNSRNTTDHTRPQGEDPTLINLFLSHFHLVRRLVVRLHETRGSAQVSARHDVYLPVLCHHVELTLQFNMGVSVKNKEVRKSLRNARKKEGLTKLLWHSIHQPEPSCLHLRLFPQNTAVGHTYARPQGYKYTLC